MSHNHLIIKHDEFGEELFEVETATYNIYKSESSIWEFVIKVTTSTAIKRSAELEEAAGALPWFEATALLDADDHTIEKGDLISQKEGYDHDREENLSNFYYFRHEPVEDMQFEIHDIQNDTITGVLKGQTIANGSKSNTCDADILLHHQFRKDSELRRGII
jgi:hypothetical protein